ncbi:MAG TPA: sigma 54-interacting transcriptional regulator [Terriglobales bacterium]|jgi:Nif-specific regulatory protein
MNPKVVGISGPLKGSVLPLPEGEASIGRDSSNDLWVTDPSLSRRHCALIRTGDQIVLRDLESRNGTIVNSVPVAEQQLQHGDQISLGDSIVVFLTKDDPSQFTRSRVQLTDTADIADTSLLLRQEDSVYLHSERLAEMPASARLTRDLNSLLKISTAIGSIRDLESLQWQLLGFIFDVVPADRGAVLVCDTPEEFVAAYAWDRVLGPGHPVPVSRTIIKRVFNEGAGIVVSDSINAEALESIPTLSDLQVRSLLCVPLLTDKKVIGAIYLDSRTENQVFDENHLQVMTAVAGISSLAVDNVRHWERLQLENQDLRAEIDFEHNMVGNSPAMREVYEFVRRVAPTDSTVLIYGESGTGKELVARALHRNSSRVENAFVAINCAAIAETLLESELFGHERGAFTGAATQKKGKIEIAEGGTLFLDEISELAPSLQAKLLRVLQEREFERVGGTRSFKLDVRVIAATNRDLHTAINSGKFRADLFYRLNVVGVTMPPLRDRRDDIPVLAEHFISKASRKCKTRTKPLSGDALACLMSHDWPGNVRELENAIERAMVLGVSDTILPDDLPDGMLEAGPNSSDPGAQYLGTIKETKKALVLQALQQANGNYIEAAKILGMHPNSLLRLIRNLDLKAARAWISSAPRQ